jgi:hypothetical protein
MLRRLEKDLKQSGDFVVVALVAALQTSFSCHIC